MSLTKEKQLLTKRYLNDELTDEKFQEKMMALDGQTKIKTRALSKEPHWHCTYIIVNDCGLFYIGLHSFPKSKYPDPWEYNGSYYGSGGMLKKAQEKIKSGWQPILITSAHSSRRAAQEQETFDIHRAQVSSSRHMCLNSCFRWDDWKEIVYNRLEETYGKYIPQELPYTARIHFLQWLETSSSLTTVEETQEIIHLLWQQERERGKRWAYAPDERIPAKFKM